MQLESIKRVIELEEFNNARIYRDFGMTGTNTDRPDYQKLLLEINLGLIDKLIAYEYSRLWRDLEEQNRLLKY